MNRSLPKPSKLVSFPLVAGSFAVGAALTVMLMPLFWKQPTIIRPTKSSVLSPAPATLSEFQKHYVSQGGDYVRIPLQFCPFPHLGGTYVSCGVEPTVELSLKDNPLPVDQISSAVTNANRQIVYAIKSKMRDSNGCPIVDLYSSNYDSLSSEWKTKKLKNDQSMWMCGALSSYVASVSPYGRFASIRAYNETKNSNSWLYDIQAEKKLPLDLPGDNLSTFLFISSPEADDAPDEFLVFARRMNVFEDIGSDQEGLFLRDNVSGKTIRLIAIEKIIKDKGFFPENITTIMYNQRNKGELYVDSGDLGSDVTFPGFDAILEGLKAQNIPQ